MCKNKLVALILAVCLSMTLLAGCGGGSTGSDTAASGTAGEGKYTVGYVNLADSDLFCVSRKTALIEATKDSDIDVQFADANNDIQKQLDLADNFIAKKVDLLILVPCDYAGVTPAVEKANAAGIPVICLGIASEGGDYVFVGSENYDAGKMQGELYAETLPENAKILYLGGTAGLSHSTDRRNGFYDALKAAGRDDVETLADLDGNYEMAKAMQITEDWIQTFPQFDAIVAANDQMALGAIEALKAAQRIEGVMVTGVDGTDDAIKAIQDGYMVQSVLQNAPGQAAAALEVINKLRAGEDPGKEVIVPFESITKDNVDQYA